MDDVNTFPEAKDGVMWNGRSPDAPLFSLAFGE